MTRHTADQSEATRALTKLGWKAARIAAVLGISERTVHRYRSEGRKDAEAALLEASSVRDGRDGD